MFRELSPLLTKYSLVLTLASVGEDRLRVTITPRPTGKDEAKELAQPFAVEGTTEELDAELPQSIVSYTAEHLTLARSLEQVKANMETALKEAKDEAARKVADGRRGSKQPSTKPTPTEAKSAVKKTVTPSLFDAPSETAPAASASAAAAAAASAPNGDGGDGESDDQASSKPLVPASKEALTDTAQGRNLFSTCREDEILQEAFNGTQDSHVAA